MVSVGRVSEKYSFGMPIRMPFISWWSFAVKSGTASGEEVELLIYNEGGHGYGMNKRGLAVDGWSDELINWILNL